MPMKSFKRSMRYRPEELAEAWRDYQANLEAVKAELPAVVTRVATEFSLHNAKFDRLRLTAACNTEVTVVAGDSERGT